MTDGPPKIETFEKLKKVERTLHADHLTQQTWLYTLSKTFPMGGQAHNNFQNPHKCGPRGMNPPFSTPIDPKWSNSMKLAILQHD